MQWSVQCLDTAPCEEEAIACYMLCNAGTVEERILALQDSKRKIVSAAFGNEDGGSQQASRLTKEDLHYLFTGQR